MAEQDDAATVQQHAMADTLPPQVLRSARRNAWFYLGAAVLLLPWIAYLAVTLPKRNLDLHYRAAWVGFDMLLVVALLTTAYMAFRVDPRIELPATVSATLLVVDAWFDIMTSDGRAQLLQALILAAFLEIPAAIFSLRLARRVERRVFEQAGLVPARRLPPARPIPPAALNGNADGTNPNTREDREGSSGAVPRRIADDLAPD